MVVDSWAFSLGLAKLYVKLKLSPCEWSKPLFQREKVCQIGTLYIVLVTESSQIKTLSLGMVESGLLHQDPLRGNGHRFHHIWALSLGLAKSFFSYCNPFHRISHNTRSNRFSL